MSSDQQKLDQILKKVEEMNAAISKIQEELRSVSASLKSLAVGQITQPPTVHVVNSSLKPAASAPKPGPATTPPKPAPSTPVGEGSKMRTLDDIRMSFPEELETRLSFEEKGEYIIIKPKQFLGSDNFAKIASAVRGMGGEYISAGKDSHFRVPKKKT
ncbi:MAG TPA: hypothetical protein VLH35_08445 [Candidatus Acidoferrales bacterium]|nr:hypothetical protein [Candidatus Acidoferrales bacterium]